MKPEIAMTHTKLKLSVAAAVVACAVAYLGFAGAKTGWVYTLPVDQYVASADQQKLRVRLCGTVAEGADVHKAQLWAKFTIKGEAQEVAVSYKGMIPDMFKTGCEVVVEGKRDPAGVFQADVLMTKCASKYEEQPQGHPKQASNAPAANAGPL
jgi:cytochrome c-type biogenesis protein CcmE